MEHHLCNLKKDTKFNEYYFKFENFDKAAEKVMKRLSKEAYEANEKHKTISNELWDKLITTAKTEGLLDNSISLKTHDFKIVEETGEVRYRLIEEGNNSLSDMLKGLFH